MDFIRKQKWIWIVITILIIGGLVLLPFFYIFSTGF